MARKKKRERVRENLLVHRIEFQYIKMDGWQKKNYQINERIYKQTNKQRIKIEEKKWMASHNE